MAKKGVVKRSMLDRILDDIEQSDDIKLGSDERKNASETIKNETEAYKNLYNSSIDPNFLIKLGAGFALGYMGMIYSETRILDTRVADKLVKPILFLK